MYFFVRKADIEDIPAILGLLSEVSRVHHEGRPDLFRSGQKYDGPALTRLLADDRYCILVAVDTSTGELYGHAICIFRETPGDRTHEPLRTLYLDDLCVSSASRGQGVGRLLVKAVRCIAEMYGCYNVTLAVWAFNERAERFYTSCGFRPQYVEMEMIVDK